MIISLGVYLIDANLNFPIARPQALVVWAMIMALINYYYIKEKQTKDNAVDFDSKSDIATSKAILKKFKSKGADREI